LPSGLQSRQQRSPLDVAPQQQKIFVLPTRKWKGCKVSRSSVLLSCVCVCVAIVGLCQSFALSDDNHSSDVKVSRSSVLADNIARVDALEAFL
jgi:hypothetical protein